MGAMDKIHNAADEAAGKAKQAVGDATDDHSLQAEGEKDEAVADLKQAGEKLKDGLRD